jgi:hypothetical protein
MSEWSEYFNSCMQNPELIKESDLFHGSMLIASNHSLQTLSEEVLGKIGADPSAPIHFNGDKYVFARNIDDEEGGYSLFIYRRIKREGEGENSEALFVSKINQFVWIGKFDDTKRGLVSDHVYRVSSAISLSTKEQEE